MPATRTDARRRTPSMRQVVTAMVLGWLGVAATACSDQGPSESTPTPASDLFCGVVSQAAVAEVGLADAHATGDVLRARSDRLRGLGDYCVVRGDPRGEFSIGVSDARTPADADRWRTDRRLKEERCSRLVELGDGGYVCEAPEAVYMAGIFSERRLILMFTEGAGRDLSKEEAVGLLTAINGGIDQLDNRDAQ